MNAVGNGLGNIWVNVGTFLAFVVVTLVVVLATVWAARSRLLRAVVPG